MGIKIQTQSKNEKKTSSLSEVMNRDITLFGGSLSNKDKEELYSEMSVLLKSGISLTKTLGLVAEGQKKQKHRQMLEDMGKEIIAGKPLYQIMEAKSDFTTYECSAVKIGGQTGKLTEITSELFQFFKQKNEQRRQVQSALFYPVIVLVTASIVVIFMMEFVVPMFVDMFKQQQVELPWITEMVIKVSNFISNYLWVIVLLAFAVPFLLRYLNRQPWFKNPIDQIKLNIPIVGKYIKKVYLTQFVQAMSLLSTSKIPVVNSIGMVKKMINFYPLQNALDSIENDLLKGGTLSESFGKHSLFDKKMIALLKVAEETNQTEFVFQKLKEQYSEELKYRSQIITAVLNPLFLIVVSIIVGIILVAMYLPMFELSSVIG